MKTSSASVTCARGNDGRGGLLPRLWRGWREGGRGRAAVNRSTRDIWWRMAWRNLWRNRRRTALTASALSFGFVAAVLMMGFMNGMMEEMVSNGTEVVTGQIQIHAERYRPERSIHDTMGGREGLDVSALVAAAAAQEGVAGVAPRLYGGGLVSSGDETVGAVLMGVDPELERRVSRFASVFVEGRMPGPGEVAVGAALAGKIGVAVGDEAVLVAPAADGSTGNDLFTVSGIYRLGLGGFDDSYALLELGTLQDFLAMSQGRIHEVAISVDRVRDADPVAESVAGAVAGLSPDLVTEPWSVFLGQLYFVVSLASAMNSIVAFIIFGMAVFGVANTMLLATFERRREFAVARALGTSGGALGRIVVYEGLLLGVVALAAGAALAFPLLAHVHANPIDLSFFIGTYSFMGSAIRPLLTVEYSFVEPLVSAVALLGTGIVSALLPAWRVARLPPADVLADR
ncbi:MAG: ABC transporter permease [Gemmatimonadota bacterium]|nr:ABC transporter permease [Gemmatimonadota bacterium]